MELNLENLKKAIEDSKYGRIKNYKTMVEILGDRHYSDKDKKKIQLKEWKRYFNYKITGNGSYEIKEIYDEPLPPKKKKYIAPTVTIKEKKAPQKTPKAIKPEPVGPIMYIYRLYQDVKNGPIVIDGYEKLCNILNIPIQEDSTNKEKQLHNLERFLEYERVEEKYFITDVLFPIITKKFLLNLLLGIPDYYNMRCIYSFSDGERIEFDYLSETYSLINATFYHYKDKINTFCVYPEEKYLKFKIEKILPNFDDDIEDVNSYYPQIKKELEEFIDNYKNNYEKGFVDLDPNKKPRKEPRLNKTIKIYEEDYKKILQFAKEKGIKILEE